MLLKKHPVGQTGQWVVCSQKDRMVELPPWVALQDKEQEDQGSEQEEADGRARECKGNHVTKGRQQKIDYVGKSQRCGGARIESRRR